MPPIVIAEDLSKTFPLHHLRVLSVKERVMNVLRAEPDRTKRSTR